MLLENKLLSAIPCNDIIACYNVYFFLFYAFSVCDGKGIKMLRKMISTRNGHAPNTHFLVKIFNNPPFWQWLSLLAKYGFRVTIESQVR